MRNLKELNFLGNVVLDHGFAPFGQLTQIQQLTLRANSDDPNLIAFLNMAHLTSFTFFVGRDTALMNKDSLDKLVVKPLPNEVLTEAIRLERLCGLTKL